MSYPPVVHVWNWQPKGPARRLTGEEVALRVFGTLPPHLDVRPL